MKGRKPAIAEVAGLAHVVHLVVHSLAKGERGGYSLK